MGPPLLKACCPHTWCRINLSLPGREQCPMCPWGARSHSVAMGGGRWWLGEGRAVVWGAGRDGAGGQGEDSSWVIPLPGHSFGPQQMPSCLCTPLGYLQGPCGGWPQAASLVRSRRMPHGQGPVKAACRQVSKLTWPAPASLHSSLPCVPIKLHFKLLLWVGGLGPGSTYGAGLGASPHRGEHGHKLGACGVGVVQSPGWILEGPEEGPGTPGAATGQTAWLRPDTGGIPAVSMYICLYFPPDQPEGRTEKHPFRVLRFTGRYHLHVNFILSAH